MLNCEEPRSRQAGPLLNAADLVDTLYRGLADNTVGKVIDGLLRHDLIILDLCRYGDYAEAAVVIGSPRCRRGFGFSA
jgi:hypothetical protein